MSEEQLLEQADVPEVEEQDAVTEEITEAEEVSDDSPETSDEQTEEDNGNKELKELNENIEDKITFEDFETQFNEDKTNTQKRIDKLTAEKYQYANEIEALKAKVNELSAKREEPEPDSYRPKYTRQQLRDAWEKAEYDGDASLKFEIQEEFTKLAVWEAEQKYVNQNNQRTQASQLEEKAWKGVVEEYSSIQDPDFNINDSNSLIIRATQKLLTDKSTASKYINNGVRDFRLAVADAHKFILQMRLKRKINSKTKQLEKNLEKEKLKNSLDASGGIGSVKRKDKKPKVDMSDRASAFNALWG